MRNCCKRIQVRFFLYGLYFKKFYLSTCSPFTTAFCKKKKVNLLSNHPLLLHALIRLIGIRKATWIPWKMCPYWCRQMVELPNIKIDVFCLISFPCGYDFSLVLYSFVCGAAVDAEISGENKANMLFLKTIVQNMTEHS